MFCAQFFVPLAALKVLSFGNEIKKKSFLLCISLTNLYLCRYETNTIALGAVVGGVAHGASSGVEGRVVSDDGTRGGEWGGEGCQL